MRNKAVTMSLCPVPSMQPSSLSIIFLHMTFAVLFVPVGGGMIAWGGLAAGLAALVWSFFTLTDTTTLFSRGGQRRPVSCRA